MMFFNLLDSMVSTFIDRSSKSHWVVMLRVFCFAVFALRIDLHTHTTDCGVENDFSDTVKNLRAIFQTRLEHCENVKNTSEHHQAVSESNHSVVAWITSYVVLVLKVDTRRGHWRTNATVRFKRKTQFRTLSFATVTSLEATAIHISLTTDVLWHVVVQNLSATAVLYII